jgi:hypothetical protein
MKTSSIIFLCLLVFVFGLALGYQISRRKSIRQTQAAVWSDYQERSSENAEFEARAYLRCLQDIDSGDITNLHEFALKHLQLYVADVRQEREKGYGWAPHIQSLYSNATIYVAEHPTQK